jgi:hypothetical protein
MRSGLDFDCSRIIFLSFIGAPPTNYETVFTSLFEASERSNVHSQKTCFATFDQPLFLKARDIVEGGQHSMLCCESWRVSSRHVINGLCRCKMTGSGFKALLMSDQPNIGWHYFE